MEKFEKFSYLEILTKLREYQAQIEQDRKDIEDLASAKGLTVRVDLEYSYRMNLYKIFPLLHLTGEPPQLRNKIETAAEEIFRLYNQPKHYLMKGLKIVSVNHSKIKTTQGSLRNLYKFKYIYDFELNYRILEEFNNGNVIIEFDLVSMDYFLDAFNYKNLDTQLIIDLITQPLKQDFKEFMKVKNNNRYSFVYRLAELNGIDTRYLNFNLILNELSK